MDFPGEIHPEGWGKGAEAVVDLSLGQTSVSRVVEKKNIEYEYNHRRCSFHSFSLQFQSKQGRRRTNRPAFQVFQPRHRRMFEPSSMAIVSPYPPWSTKNCGIVFTRLKSRLCSHRFLRRSASRAEEVDPTKQSQSYIPCNHHLIAS